MIEQKSHQDQPVTTIVRKDFATLHKDFTVQEALDDIRSQGLGDKIVYFYAVDEKERLVGVVPTRRLLTAPLKRRISEVMIDRVVAIPRSATVLEACEFFVFHKFLGFPVVDDERHILGVVDVGMFTDEVFDVADQERMQEVFETIGFRVAQVRDASPIRAFRFRFPWLLCTIGGGTICALLAGAYEVTLAKSLLIAFFLTLVLGLGESVSMQTMTVTIQSLRSNRPTLAWYGRMILREAGTALLLGAACGLTVGLVVWLWRGAGMAALAIGSSIPLVLCAAGFFGLSIPVLLHALRLDLRIAAGPFTLAVTDISTILLYFTLAALLL